MDERKIRDEANLVVRLRPEEAERIRASARTNERSVAAELRVAVRFYLEKMGVAA
jgi:hypothetical protein